MRVCFDTLCFSSRLRPADEEAAVDRGPRPSVVLIRQDQIMSQQQQQQGSVEELQALLRAREEEIGRLEELLRRREEEILDLRSHLDKFQSVFPFHLSPTHRALNNNAAAVAGTRPRKQRTGISAEPQSEASLQELAQQTFRTYEKDERWVF